MHVHFFFLWGLDVIGAIDAIAAIAAIGTIDAIGWIGGFRGFMPQPTLSDSGLLWSGGGLVEGEKFVFFLFQGLDEGDDFCDGFG